MSISYFYCTNLQEKLPKWGRICIVYEFRVHPTFAWSHMLRETIVGVRACGSGVLFTAGRHTRRDQGRDTSKDLLSVTYLHLLGPFSVTVMGKVWPVHLVLMLGIWFRFSGPSTRDFLSATLNLLLLGFLNKQFSNLHALPLITDSHYKSE